MARPGGSELPSVCWSQAARCLRLVCIRMRFLDLFDGVSSLYCSINPCCLSSLEIPFTVCPFFSKQIRSLQVLAQKTLSPQPGAPAAGRAQFCHRLTCLWFQPSGGERERELGAGTGAPCGPAKALLPEHHFVWQQPAGAAALCRRAEGSPYAFTGVLSSTGIGR